MTNEEEIEDVNPNEKINEDGTKVILEEGDEGYVKPELKDEKIEYTPSEKLAFFKRRQEQLLKQHPELREEDKSKEDKSSKKSSKKSEEFDYSEKAFLIANGIKESDEVDLVKAIMTDTGKSLDDVLESKYFQAELKEIRDVKITTNAIPSGSKRTGQSAQNTVEYWIAKNELPPADQRELRQKVVNERIKKEKVGNVFTNNPVIGK